MTFSSTRPKVALVTGSAGIIGPGVCAALKADGWLIAAADYKKESFERYQHLHGEPFPADFFISGDLRQRDDCIRIVEEAVAHFGSLTLLVNGATAHAAAYPLLELPQGALEDSWRIDVLAPIYMIQAATPALSESHGAIINFSSILTRTVPTGRLGYVAAKGAIEGMTESLAYELAPKNVRVNVIRIGAVAGDAFLRSVLERLPADLAARLYRDVLPEHYDISRTGSLVGEAGTPAHIGSMVVYLMSPAGGYINAAVLPVDGAFKLVQIRRGRDPEFAVKNHVHDRWTNDPDGELKKWLKEKGINYEV